MDTILAENLKKLREKHSITQEALAEALGVTAIAVYMWEAGRLPLEYKMIVKIADFYDVTVDSLLEDETADNSNPVATDKISFNCKICGGDLDYNYTDGTCRCANCGNKWSISELYPKYAGVIATITKANRILDRKTDLASADEANLLFRQAIIECNKFNDAISAELVKVCNEGQSKAEQLEIYCRGKHFFDNKAYKSAVTELEKVRGFRDADEMLKRCKRRN
ncbi:MAG: helix-turn-helix transcriptional regulator [Clostridiales bacterium]|nr:helix-turn-helix transcriptional regulator [Clostridiales bacterium]